VVREALESLARVLEANPEKGRVKNAPARARLLEGLRCRVEGPNGESLHTDMPRPMGGAASASNPGWLLRAAIASCATTVIAMRAARQGIELSLLELSVESMSDNCGLLGLGDVPASLDAMTVRVKIAAPGRTAAELKALAEWGDAHSPVGCTVRRGLDYAMEVEVCA
jgi:organic hydroperoxide reductase OsmC/OhrA